MPDKLVNDCLNSQVSFVTCLEGGPLEQQVIRMISSLRRFGGNMSDSKVFTVAPRISLPLASRTKRFLKEHNVEHIKPRPGSQKPWYNLMNKPVAMAAVESEIKTPFIAWIDSDTIFVREPADLILSNDEDLCACATDRGGIGSTGPDDKNDLFWAAICSLLKFDLDSLPLTDVIDRGKAIRIRLYWNSGVFCYRSDSAFGQSYLEVCHRMLSARIAHHQHGFYFHEQASLGMAMLLRGFRYREFKKLNNYSLMVRKDGVMDEERVRIELPRAAIVHYHQACRPLTWSRFIGLMSDCLPEVASWLIELGPLHPPKGGAGLALRMLNTQRKIRRRVYWALSRRY
jgi:hypothetical protein